MNKNWSKGELKAAVKAYIEMHTKELNNQTFVKSHYYRDLSQKFGRTEKSFEYRMQNISYVYSLMGRSWLSGLKPAKNVGSKNASIIEQLISEIEGTESSPVAAFETKVIDYKQSAKLDTPDGVADPLVTSSVVTKHSRDPKVKAWVLKNADGSCEHCSCPAPFITAQGEPFLEVHHLRQLADGGSDTIFNAIALCPNCHRQLHYAANKAHLTKKIYDKVHRLIHE